MGCNSNTEQNSTQLLDEKQAKSQGFTLVELMIAVGIVSILFLVATESYRQFLVRSQLSEMATTLGKFAREFETWEQVNGRYPNDSHVVLPDARGLAINPTEWSATTGIGGNWNWEGPDRYSYAGISIVGASSVEEDIIQFDALIDNGDLSNGKFRRTGGGRYTYILSE